MVQQEGMGRGGAYKGGKGRWKGAKGHMNETGGWKGKGGKHGRGMYKGGKAWRVKVNQGREKGREEPGSTRKRIATVGRGDDLPLTSVLLDVEAAEDIKSIFTSWLRVECLSIARFSRRRRTSDTLLRILTPHNGGNKK